MSFVQLNAGNDTLDFSATSAQSTVKGGQGDDSITVGGSQLDVNANKGADTLNLTASTSSTFDAGEGENYIEATLPLVLLQQLSTVVLPPTL